MSTAISFSAPRMVPQITEPTASRPVAAATDSAPTVARSEPAPTPQLPSVREETERDPSGLTVFRTVELATGSLVAQFPTEAYLRLANAMKQVGRPAPNDASPAGKTV